MNQQDMRDRFEKRNPKPVYSIAGMLTVREFNEMKLRREIAWQGYQQCAEDMMGEIDAIETMHKLTSASATKIMTDQLAELDAARLDVERLRGALQSISEYWNGEPEAAAEAYEYAICTADEALAAPKVGG